MAQVMKFARGAVGHLLAHYERRQVINKKTEEAEYVRFGNRDIDTRWSHLNYRAWPPVSQELEEQRGIYISQDLQDLFDVTGQDPEETAMARFRRIFRDTKHASRRDLKCFCGWCISLPDEIPCDRMGQFFDLCTQYCVRKYGAENVVGAWVHVDEAHRPHLHVAFVPVTGTGDERRICAKDVLTRKHLSDWHGGLTSLVKQEMQIENPGVENGRTAQQGGNRSIKLMKASDRAYKRTKGAEVDRWRLKASEALKEALRRQERGSLQDNILVAESERSEAALQPQRKRSIGEYLRRK